MLLRVHRAAFGEHEGFHAALAASLDDRGFLDELRDRTDRPPHHLPGTGWQPFERGFIVRGWYALCRTFPDPGASRGGMVKSFVVFAPITEMARLNNFATLLSQLPSRPDLPWPCAVTEVEADENQRADTPQGEIPGLAKLVRALINRTDVRLPVVWVGQRDAREAITALWNASWPALRRTFQFDLRFAATDLERLELTVVVIPEKAVGVWHGTSPLVRPGDPPPPERTPAEEALLGGAEGEPIRALFRELGTEPVSFRALKVAALCVACRQTLPQAGPAEAYSYLGLLATLAPLSSQGLSLKEEALQSWAAVGSRFGAADVLALRNFPATAFPRGEATASDLAGRWLRVHLPRPSFADNTAGVLLQALKSEPYCRAWNDQVRNEAARLLEESGASMAAVLWHWWRLDWRLGQFAASHLPEGHTVEKALVAARPDAVSDELARSVRALAAARGWGVLHAAICVISLPPPAAFAAQLSLRRTEGVAGGLRLLGAQFSPQDSLDAALASGDVRLVQIAGELCAKQPALVPTLNWGEAVARQILVVALDVDFRLWKQLGGRRAILHGLLDFLVRGEWKETSLLEHLSSTDEADLLNYPRRTEVWSHLPVSAKDGFLRATANGWIAAFRADPRTVAAPEEPLGETVFRGPHLDRLLAINSAEDFSIGLHAFEAFRRLDESVMQSWIHTLARTHGVGEFDRLQVDRLGALILQQKWLAAAQALRQAAGSRDDLVPALLGCLSLFGVIERLAIRFTIPGKSQIDAYEFWQVLEAELVTVYPQGPCEENLWSRAGGDVSLLERRGSGRRQWQNALHLLKRGGGGKHFTVQKLAAKVCHDFPRNERFHLLEKCAHRLDV